MKWLLPLLASLLVSCTTKPDKFEVLSTAGNITTARLSRSEMHVTIWAVPLAQTVRDNFVAACKAKAAKEGRSLESIAIVESDVKGSALAGHYSASVTGRMKYGREPFEGVRLSDTSLLMSKAEQIQHKLENNVARAHAIGAGITGAMEASQARADTRRTQYSIDRLSNAVDRNTSAVQQLNGTLYY